MLANTVTLPKDQDVVWMSQFLDCFSEQEIEKIFKDPKVDGCLKRGLDKFIDDCIYEQEPEVDILKAYEAEKIVFAMKKSLKKQKCPRMYIHGEKGRLQYGFNRKHNKLTEKEDYQRRLNFIHEEPSKEAVILIENLSSMYAKDHNFPKKMPWE